MMTGATDPSRSTRDVLNMRLKTVSDRSATHGPTRPQCTSPDTYRPRWGGEVRARFDHLIRTRTREGRERAKARGVKLGRKPKLTDYQKREAIRRRDVLDGVTP